MRDPDQIREDFEREVDIVRGAGGFAPTTADLQHLGEQLAYASIAPQHGFAPTTDDGRWLEAEQAELDQLRHEDATDVLRGAWPHRHDNAGERRFVLAAIGVLKELRAKEAERRVSAEREPGL